MPGNLASAKEQTPGPSQTCTTNEARRRGDRFPRQRRRRPWAASGSAESGFRSPERHPFTAKVVNVGADGVVNVVAVGKDASLPPVKDRATISKGDFLGMVFARLGSSRGARLLQVSVSEIGQAGQAKIQIPVSAVGNLKPGDYIGIVRPIGATASSFKAIARFRRA